MEHELADLRIKIYLLEEENRQLKIQKGRRLLEQYRSAKYGNVPNTEDKVSTKEDKASTKEDKVSTKEDKVSTTEDKVPTKDDKMPTAQETDCSADLPENTAVGAGDGNQSEATHSANAEPQSPVRVTTHQQQQEHFADFGPIDFLLEGWDPPETRTQQQADPDVAASMNAVEAGQIRTLCQDISSASGNLRALWRQYNPSRKKGPLLVKQKLDEYRIQKGPRTKAKVVHWCRPNKVVQINRLRTYEEESLPTWFYPEETRQN